MSVFQSFKSFANRIGMSYVRILCEREYRRQSFVGVNERPIEFAFLFRQLTQAWPHTVLDVGTGMTALPHLMSNCGFHVTATDNIRDYWPAGMTNRHYHVVNDDITKTELTGGYDFISCISVLEHIRTHRNAMTSMYGLLNPGGRLVLTFPYNEHTYVENVYHLPESTVTEKYPFITQAFSRSELNMWLFDSPFKILEQEFWQFSDGEYWTCGTKVTPPRRVVIDERHQLCCLVLEKTS